MKQQEQNYKNLISVYFTHIEKYSQVIYLGHIFDKLRRFADNLGCDECSSLDIHISSSLIDTTNGPYHIAARKARH